MINTFKAEVYFFTIFILGICIEAAKEDAKPATNVPPATDDTKTSKEKTLEKRKVSLPNMRPPLHRGVSENRPSPSKQLPRNMKSPAPGIPKMSSLSPRAAQVKTFLNVCHSCIFDS